MVIFIFKDSCIEQNTKIVTREFIRGLHKHELTNEKLIPKTIISSKGNIIEFDRLEKNQVTLLSFF